MSTSTHCYRLSHLLSTQHPPCLTQLFSDFRCLHQCIYRTWHVPIVYLRSAKNFLATPFRKLVTFASQPFGRISTHPEAVSKTRWRSHVVRWMDNIQPAAQQISAVFHLCCAKPPAVRHVTVADNVHQKRMEVTTSRRECTSCRSSPVTKVLLHGSWNIRFFFQFHPTVVYALVKHSYNSFNAFSFFIL